MKQAGWYPDPSGVGQRYWDGQQWGPTAPPPLTPMPAFGPPPAPKKKSSWFGVIVLIVGVLWLAGQCTKDDKHSSSSSPSSTATTSPTASARSKLPTRIKFHTEQGTIGEILFAEFPISDNFTAGLRTTQAQIDTIEVLRYAAAEYPTVARVWVQGSFPMVDQYGNTSTDVILNVGYDKSTLDKINFDGINPDKIWEIRDAGSVHPELR